MIPTSKFQVIDSFKLTHRGLVICGHIIEGKISTGDCIQLANEYYTISAVEMIDNIRDHISYVGIVLPVYDDHEAENLQQLCLKNQITTIFCQ